MIETVGNAIEQALDSLKDLSRDQLKSARREKFLAMGNLDGT